MEIVDAHHHIWDLSAVHYPWLSDEIEPHFMFGDYSQLRANYLPADYQRDSAAWPVISTVHCEAEADRADPIAETRWLEQQRRLYGFPNALVVWADFGRPDFATEIEEHFAVSPQVRGVRCKPRLPDRTNPTPQPGGFDDPVWLKGLAALEKYNLSWDLRVPWWYLTAAAKIAARNPSLPIILNHCGLPWERDAESLSIWRSGMRALAVCPNVSVKLSELGLKDRAWSEEDNLPILRETIDAFGPSRCVFASNFPVARMRVDYDRWVAAVDSALAAFRPDERADVFSRNALRFYRIDRPATLSGSAATS